jgi:thymidylate kinase
MTTHAVARRADPLYVELVGLPGSGKTTVGAEVVGKLNDASLRCVSGSAMGSAVHVQRRLEVAGRRSWMQRSRWERTLYYLGIHLRDRQLARTAYACALRGQNVRAAIGTARELLLLHHRVCNSAAVVGAGAGDLIFYDQGMLHPARQLLARLARDRAPTWMARLVEALSNAPVRTRMIVLQIDPAEAALRIDARVEARAEVSAKPLGRFDRLPLEIRRRELAHQHRVLEELLGEIERQMPAGTVVRVDAHQPAPAVAADVARAIQHDWN